jgi:hypothetical protein
MSIVELHMKRKTKTGEKRKTQIGERRKGERNGEENRGDELHDIGPELQERELLNREIIFALVAMYDGDAESDLAPFATMQRSTAFKQALGTHPPLLASRKQRHCWSNTTLCSSHRSGKYCCYNVEISSHVGRSHQILVVRCVAFQPSNRHPRCSEGSKLIAWLEPRQGLV